MSFDLGSLFKMAALAALTMGTGGAAAPLMGAEAAGGAAGAAGGGGWLSSLLGGGMAGAAPGVALPAATSGAGIANASPEFLSAVGLPDLAGSGATAAGSTSMAAPDSMLNQWLKTGSNAMDLLGKAKQASAPTTPPPTPGASAPLSSGGAPPISFGGGGGEDPYRAYLAKIMKQHSGMGGGY